jgi:DNA-directed RNA polymerase specialized sigma24 family protein
VDVGAVSDPPTPQTQEQDVIQRERLHILSHVLRSLSSRDREVLTRFYVQEQPADQIMNEMGLTPTQFRLLKSRAKARFVERGKRSLSRHPRTSPSANPREVNHEDGPILGAEGRLLMSESIGSSLA